MSDYFQDGAIQLILYESGGGLAETGGLAVPHPRPKPPLFNRIINSKRR